MEKRKDTFLGLTADEAERSIRENGKNILSKQKKKSFLSRFFSNLNDPVIRILLGALVINIFFSLRGGNVIETVGIAIAVFLAAFISTVSEHSAGNAFEKLERDDESALCRVRRDGCVAEIPISDIAVGDIVLLSAGEIVPADGYIVSGMIYVDQSLMTGESRDVKKYLSDIKKQLTPECPSALLRGCAVLSGEAEMQICAVGDKTFLGEISKEIQQDTRESPLRIRLSKLAGQISKIGYLLAALVAFAYLFNAFVLDSGFKSEIILIKLADKSYLISKLFSGLTLGLTVMVMAVPEGLPMMIAVVLSANLRKMLRDNVLVRKAVGIEAAGSMNILFTDKTGTLTEGKFAVSRLMLGDGSEVLDLSCENWFTKMIALSCYYNSLSSVSDNGTVIGGNGVDRALLNFALSNGCPDGYTLLSREPFDSARKYSSATVKSGNTRIKLLKGAPDIVLPQVKYFFAADGSVRELDRSSFSRILRNASGNGGRIIVLTADVGKGPCLLCAAEFSDRIRLEAPDAVARLCGAGIQLVMITGDGKDTACGIARRCGIIREGRELCLTSDELAKISDVRLRELLPSLAVVARALPTDKSRLVRIAQESGLVTGMTGDGVNDAPALKMADVGFAVGSGTPVAKEAGDIVILDDNLASIVKAVLYGRTVFKSIRKFVTLQLLMNLCASGVSMIGPFIGIDSPVTVTQMLWINIIMDTLGGLAFAGEPPRQRYMEEAPKRRDEPILNGYMISTILLHGGFTLALGIAFLKHPFIKSHFLAYGEDIKLLTAFFAFFIFSSVLNCFSARTDRLNLFAGIMKNKVFLFIMAVICFIQTVFIYLGGEVLRTVPLDSTELVFTLGISLLVIPADFIRKVVMRMSGVKNGY